MIKVKSQKVAKKSSAKIEKKEVGEVDNMTGLPARPNNLDYSNGIFQTYSGDASLRDFLINMMCTKIEQFFSFDDWVAHHLGLNDKQKEGFRILSEMLITGYGDFSFFLGDYDLHNLDLNQRDFLVSVLKLSNGDSLCCIDIDIMIDGFFKDNSLLSNEDAS